MNITKSHVFTVVGSLGVLLIGSCMLEAGLFSSAPRPDAVFGSWALDDEEVEVRAEAVAESLRSQGADAKAAQSAREREAESLRQYASLTLSISEESMRLSEAPGKERSWTVVFSPAKPDIVHVTIDGSAEQRTFRVRGRNRIDLLQEMGAAIPLRRMDAE